MRASVRGRSLSLGLESANQKDERERQNVEPADHAKTVHEGQEQTLTDPLLIDDTQRCGTGVSDGKPVIYELRDERMGALLNSL